MIASDTRKEALFIFILLAFTYGYFVHQPKWNGNSRLGLTFAIVQEGRLTIDSFHDMEGMDTGDKAFYNGHYYSDKAIGSSLVASLFYYPLYRLEQLSGFKLSLLRLKYLLTFFSIGLPSALAGSLMYILCRQVTGSRLRAYVSTIAMTLGTMIFPFSVIFFGHVLTGSLLFSAFFLIFQLKADARHAQPGILFLIGCMLGLALITEYTAAPIVLILTAYYFYTLLTAGMANRSLVVILPALGACIPVALQLAYNTAVFGSPLSVGYQYAVVPVFQQGHSEGLVGIGWPNLRSMFYLTVHPGMGLFWQSPVLILSMIGTWFMARRSSNKAEALIAIAAFLSLLVINSGHFMWWGGQTFAPRYLIPMLPFLCLPLTFIPGRWFSGVAILGLISVAQMFIPASGRITTADDFFWQIEQQGYFAYSSIYSSSLEQLLTGGFARNLGNELFSLSTWLSLTPLLLVILVITLLFFVRKDYSTMVQPIQDQLPLKG